MRSLLSHITEHGYSILCAAVFMEAVGIPIPAAIALLIAGAAGGHGSMNIFAIIASALSAMMVADILMFLLGRHTGWWLLGLLCRLSMNSESCITRAADLFYRRGSLMLIFAKFIPGINTMAPPLAGSMNMGIGQFLRLDLLGASLYVGAYLAVGYLFSGAIETIVGGYEAFGRALGWIMVVLIAGYAGFQIWNWRKARALRIVPFVLPLEASRLLASADAVFYDARSHGYYDQKAVRIHGSSRLEPNSLTQFETLVPVDKQIYVYCTCLRDATSVRVAYRLQELGIRVAVIQGGLRAWLKAGLPVEAVPEDEIAHLPVFR